ncbi:MAG: leucine-rich repeat protein [Clostridia bacterium]|nr:leucine-rich repeat protein [Clostridia bacterium]
MKSILISHSNKEPDKTISLALYNYLSEQHIDCWIDALITSGEWDDQIGEVMYDAPVNIFVASPNSMIPPAGKRISQTMKEVKYFIEQGRLIIPFVLDTEYYQNPGKEAGAAIYEFGNNSYQAVFMDKYPTQEAAFARLLQLLPQDISRTENNPADFIYAKAGTVLLEYKGHDECVNIPESVVEIDKEAFCNNADLVKVIIPPSVKKIGIRAFFGCERLKKIEGMKGLKEVESSAFELSGVDPEESDYYFSGIAFGGNKDEEICVADGTVIVANEAFRYSSANRILLPKGLKTIGELSFADNAFLEIVTIPATVEYIGKNAFRGCSRLQKVIFEGKIPFGAQDAFERFDEIVIKENN